MTHIGKMNLRIRIHNLYGQEIIVIPMNEPITKLDISNLMLGLCYMEGITSISIRLQMGI